MPPRIAVEPLKVADPLALPSFEEELQHRWFVWDAWTAGRRRVDLHPIVLSEGCHREAVRVAEQAWALVAAAGDRAAADPAERALYHLHPDVERLAAASRTAGDVGVIARVDLLLGEDGRFFACEVNADCPGGYNETIALPVLARKAGAHAHRDPTHVALRLADRLVAEAKGGLIALAYATAYAEDLQVCALLERLIAERGGRAARTAPTAFKAMSDGGLSLRGERVAVLYRFYPLEYMAGQANLEAIAQATERGLVVTMSSFGCIYAQSKLAMARAFAHDPVAAAEVFPETRAFADLGAERLLAERAAWVVKRDLSRVGDHVFVGALTGAEAFSEILGEVTAADGDGQAWIAQRYVPQAPLSTPWGPQLVTLGAYLLDGGFAGYFARLSPTSHCSHDALVLPVFVRDEADASTEEAA